MNTGNTVCFITTTSSGPFLFIDIHFLKQIGVGWVQGTIANGQRRSSATTYVGPNYINRPNLHILLHAHATKLLEAAGLGTTTPTFNGVEFGTGPPSKFASLITRVLLLTGCKVEGGRWQPAKRSFSARGCSTLRSFSCSLELAIQPSLRIWVSPLASNSPQSGRTCLTTCCSQIHGGLTITTLSSPISLQTSSRRGFKNGIGLTRGHSRGL